MKMSSGPRAGDHMLGRFDEKRVRFDQTCPFLAVRRTCRARASTTAAGPSELRRRRAPGHQARAALVPRGIPDVTTTKRKRADGERLSSTRSNSPA